MRYLQAILLTAVVCPHLQAGATLKTARERYLHGNSAEAREMYQELARQPRLRVQATIGIANTFLDEGQYAKALTALDKALKDEANNPELLANKAHVHYLKGEWKEAEKAADLAIARKDEQFLAHWIRGQLLRDRGDLDAADNEFRWFIRVYVNRSDNEMEITDPEELRLIALAGLERARWYHLTDQFQFILDEVLKYSVKKHPDYWPAEFEAGKLFLEKHNKAEAAKSFNRALAINPRAANVLAYKGLAAMQRLDLGDAELYADQALAINPAQTDALRLKSDVLMFAGETKEALALLEKARAVNPREEPTLARIAAIYRLERKQKEFDALVKDVEKHNSHAGVFYYELAEGLEQRKLYGEAEKYYLQSIKLLPKLPWAQNGLGMLYMRVGREEEALKILDKAFDADRFNIRVSNTLRVLAHLARYKTLETDHFLIRYDPDNDKVLANFMAKYLEETFDELAKKFHYQPKGKILFEIFNKHEMFSGRVVALPDLHTIGACTGPVVAMVSPRDVSGVSGRPYNWVRVIRHELVHVFNLDQTNNQVPHWFTEGLAVTLEGKVTPPSWHALLAQKMASDELLNLDNILMAFVRPKSQLQWQQAYLQSQLYVEFVTKTYGDEVLSKLLDGFAEGLDTAGALEKACKISKADFEKAYRGFLDQRVEKNAGAGRKVLTFRELKKAHAKDPDDADIAAQLAEAYLDSGNRPKATELADKVLIAKTKHPLAAYVKAVLLLDSGDGDLALTMLENNVDEKTAEPKTLKLLAKLQLQNKQIDAAARTLEQGRKLAPSDPAWLGGLAAIYKKNGDDAKLREIYIEVARIEPDDLVSRKKLAKDFAKEGNNAEAEKYALQILEIDVLDETGQEILLEALEAQNKAAELREYRKLLEK